MQLCSALCARRHWAPSCRDLRGAAPTHKPPNPCLSCTTTTTALFGPAHAERQHRCRGAPDPCRCPGGGGHGGQGRHTGPGRGAARGAGCRGSCCGGRGAGSGCSCDSSRRSWSGGWGWRRGGRGSGKQEWPLCGGAGPPDRCGHTDRCRANALAVVGTSSMGVPGDAGCCDALSLRRHSCMLCRVVAIPQP